MRTRGLREAYIWKLEKKFKSSESTAQFQVSGKSKFEKLKIERKIDEPPGFQPVRA